MIEHDERQISISIRGVILNLRFPLPHYDTYDFRFVSFLYFRKKLLNVDGNNREQIEGSDIENYQILQQIMKHYADQGYEIALDDVGAGHSGLNRVVNTTPDYLKADIELVRDIHKYKKKEIMMKLLLDYCNATGAILIAEGIETVQELECLHSLGVHYGQGFFLGKPERAFGNISAESEEILERLNRRKNILFLDISGK